MNKRKEIINKFKEISSFCIIHCWDNIIMGVGLKRGIYAKDLRNFGYNYSRKELIKLFDNIQDYECSTKELGI